MAFFNACRNTARLGPALCIYIHEPSQIALPTSSQGQQAFLWECLDSLHLQLATCGGALFEWLGEATNVLELLLDHFEISQIHSTLEITDARAYERDKSVARLLNARQVPWQQYPQHNVGRGGSRQLEFGAYFAQAQAQPLKNPYGKNLAARFYQGPLGTWVSSGSLPRLLNMPTSSPGTPDRTAVPHATGQKMTSRLAGGRVAAERALNAFFSQKIDSYPKRMSSARTAFEACSRLSAYLSLGVLSDFEVLFEANRSVNLPRLEGKPNNQQQQRESSVLFWLDRMHWRQGYFARLEANPKLETETTELDVQRQRTVQTGLLQAWETGHTGFPYLDACIRALNHTGYLNMRARGMVASFAMMQLWQPWQTVGVSLARRFLDYEPAIHWNQIRIHAGSFEGAPLMMYCPIKQSEDQDPTGQFIAQHVPELAPWIAQTNGANRALAIHRPWLCPDFERMNYPAPIVCPDTSYSLAKSRLAGKEMTSVGQQTGLF